MSGFIINTARWKDKTLISENKYLLLRIKTFALIA